MASQEICIICNKPITVDHSSLTERGVETILTISAELADGLDKRLANTQLPVPAHKACKNSYTKPSNVKKRKRLSTAADDGTDSSVTKHVRRSQVSSFDIKTHCLYCGEYLDYDKLIKKPKDKRDSVHDAATKELLSSVASVAMGRGDSWGEAVYVRIQNVGDLVAAEAKYHHSCQIRFHQSLELEKKNVGRPAGSVDRAKQVAFISLCKHIDDSDIHQYSITDLDTIMKKYSENGDCYTAKHLKQKLKEHYGDTLIISNEHGKETIYTFLDEGNRILREHYKASGLKPKEIIDMAATLIEDQMRTLIYDQSKYPKFSDLDNSGNMVSELLLRLLSRLITSRKSKRRVISLSHGITAAARPRSFVSPILLAVSVYINSRLESRELVDLLSSLGFADDYREVLRLYDAMLPRHEKNYDWEGALVNFVFDNADIDVCMLTGHGTWHAMGGIVGVTPAGDVNECELERSTTIRPAVEAGKFGELPLKRYIRPVIPGLKKVMVGPLEPPNTEPSSLLLATALDTVWLSSYFICNPLKCPSWSGFNQSVMAQGEFDVSRIEVLPFINHNPSQLDTIYTTLCYAQKLTEKYNLSVSPVTFDQPLYAKATEIAESSSNLPNIFIRLGGFHLLMSYLGCIGHIMSESGLSDQWKTVYAPNSVKHMLSGHAYARALRAHMLSSASVMARMLATPDCLNGINLDEARTVHEMLLNHSSSPDTLLTEHVTTQVSHVVEDLEEELSLSSRTGKLWIQYLKMVKLLLLFIRAERTGDWDLHLLSVSRMIPIFHAGGHTAYAKCSRLYLDQMKRLSQDMSEAQFVKYTSEGYWTIRRSHRFWSGVFTDQTIEQTLMRMLKTRGGLAHGRGITPSTQSKMVCVLPQTTPVCASLEDFCGTHVSTTDQHTDLRPTATARDGEHFIKFNSYLSTHSPFSYTGEYAAKLVRVATGVVAPSSANADNAFHLGEEAAARLTGTNYADAKLRRNDKVVSIGSANNSAEVRGQQVEIKPLNLFMRITCIIRNRAEMQDHLKYELSKYPPAFFENDVMRKNTKSDFAKVLKANAETLSAEALPDATHVIDGGHLLQSVPWPSNCTYMDVCDNYVNYVTNNYGPDSVVCFDGYSDLSMSTKAAEQRRRAQGKNVSQDILFELSSQVTGNQHSILANPQNKARLIAKLMMLLTNEGIACHQSTADADFLICNTAIELAGSSQNPVIVVGRDTDLLVMLVDRALPNLYMQYARHAVYSTDSIKRTLHLWARDRLLVAHAITGCDSVSALYNIGKKKALKVLAGEDLQILDVFKRPDAACDDIARAGEMFLLKMYSATPRSTTLDKSRFNLYLKKMKTSHSTFDLDSLPPTSSAAKFHAYRAYFAVQEWLGNPGRLEPINWGWQLCDGMLHPVFNDKDPAPAHILRMISCGCKTGCGKRCMCRKSGLNCTEMCSNCIGLNCTNASPVDENDD